MEFIRIEADYTGGDIYSLVGSLSDGTYFIADSCCYDVRLINSDPFKEDYDTIFMSDWQESHLINDLDRPESYKFFVNALKWVVNNKPSGNYQITELETHIRRLEELLK